MYFYDKRDENAYEKFIKSKIKSLKTNKSIDCTKFNTLIEIELKEIIFKRITKFIIEYFLFIKNLKNRYSDKNYELIISISKYEKLSILS